MAISELLLKLGDEIEDAYEESFLLFSHPIPSQNLGFVDPKASSLEIVVGDLTLDIQQSPTLLSSDREGGTTGAVLWKITPLFAEWITAKNNILFETGVISGTSTVLELGCGVSGILALAMAPRVRRYIATDQDYVFRLLRRNLERNAGSSTPAATNRKAKSHFKSKAIPAANSNSNIDILSLDWETSDLTSLPSLLNDSSTIDIVLACDCIYNEALIAPFVRTCVEVCRSSESTLCVIAQQLRSNEVFEAWLGAFNERFRVWRVGDEWLSEELRAGGGFVVHVGVLREDGDG